MKACKTGETAGLVDVIVGLTADDPADGRIARVVFACELALRDVLVLCTVLDVPDFVLVEPIVSDGSADVPATLDRISYVVERCSENQMIRIPQLRLSQVCRTICPPGTPPCTIRK